MTTPTTALVTGATGFIGRRLAARLAKDGHRVRALVLPGEDPAAIPELAGIARLEVVTGDVTDGGSIARAVSGAGRVYHLAAVVGDWGDEDAFERINVGGTRHVLDAAAHAGVERVVMVSSIVVYGSQLRTGPCDEDAPRELGVGPYSRTKRASEELALDYDAFGRVPVTVIRPGNVFGPGSSLWVDEVAALLRKGAAMWLDDGDGDADLAFVDNVVDVIARAADASGAAGRIYNATDGAGVTWKQYLTDLAAAAGAPPPRRHLPAGVATAVGAAMAHAQHRPLFTREAAQLLASRAPVPNARAAAELGYEPVPYARAMDSVSHYLKERAS
jgi:nucleoside-diphosphate-sugar epimerase